MTPERLEKVRKQLVKRRVDAIILTSVDNIRYAAGFTGSTATAVVSQDRAVILVDPRYTLQATQDCPNFEVREYFGEITGSITELLADMSPGRVGFEADYVTIAQHRMIRKWIPAGASLVSTKRVMEELRIVKESGEVEKIRKSVELTDECFKHLLSFIKPGMTEREVALEVYLFFYKRGAKPCFDTIVACGPHAAFPHFKTSDSKLERGQMIKIDMGSHLNGYNADLTRTIFLGQPNDKQKEVYNVVLEAQLAAIRAIKPGKMGKEIDAVARDYIKSKGYGDYFGHGLGHSLGMGVHDGPGFTASSKTVMEPGMVMTVEPGIYIEGWGGVRIEDDIVVTKSGCEVLTRATKEMVVL